MYFVGRVSQISLGFLRGYWPGRGGAFSTITSEAVEGDPPVRGVVSGHPQALAHAEMLACETSGGSTVSRQALTFRRSQRQVILCLINFLTEGSFYRHKKGNASTDIEAAKLLPT